MSKFEKKSGTELTAEARGILLGKITESLAKEGTGMNTGYSLAQYADAETDEQRFEVVISETLSSLRQKRGVGAVFNAAVVAAEFSDAPAMQAFFIKQTLEILPDALEDEDSRQDVLTNVSRIRRPARQSEEATQAIIDNWDRAIAPIADADMRMELSRRLVADLLPRSAGEADALSRFAAERVVLAAESATDTVTRNVYLAGIGLSCLTDDNAAQDTARHLLLQNIAIAKKESMSHLCDLVNHSCSRQKRRPDREIDAAVAEKMRDFAAPLTREERLTLATNVLTNLSSYHGGRGEALSQSCNTIIDIARDDVREGKYPDDVRNLLRYISGLQEVKMERIAQDAANVFYSFPQKQPKRTSSSDFPNRPK